MTQCEALIAIAKRNGGVLTPNKVIEEASDEKSVLHNAFTWDDTEAANKWRVYEAQQLIRKFHIDIETANGESVKCPVFINLSVDRTNESKHNPYRLVEDISKSTDLMAVAVKDAMQDLLAVKQRHGHLKQLSEVWEAIDAVK